MFWMLPLLGAGLGALSSKNHLKGALLGAAAGTGAGAIPGLLGGGAALGAATNPALIESAVGTAGYGASSASPYGITGLLGDAAKYAQPAANVLGAANSAKSLFGQQPQMAPQGQPLMAGNDPIASLMNNQQQQDMLRKQLMDKLQRKMYGGTL